MKKTKRIIALALAIIMIVGTMFSLSSCLSTFLHILENVPGNGNFEIIEGGNQENEGSGEGSGPSSGEGSGNGSAGSNGGEAEFLPGSENNGELVDSVSDLQRAVLSTVLIRVTHEVYAGDFNGYGYDDYIIPETSAGSGVIYQLDRESGDAYIITNYHVVYEADSITSNGIADTISVYLYGQEYSTYAIPATYVGGSMTYDIAVLKVEDSEVLRNSLAVAASVADSDKISIMDECYVIGNAEGEGMSVTEGIISVDSESLTMTGADNRTTVDLRVIRVSAAVNSGNSGGGLYDENGKLIGIVVAKKTGDDVDNMGYAIPSTLAQNLVDNIIDNCNGTSSTSLKRVLLGITLSAYTTGLTVDEETGKIVRSELVEIVELSDTCLFLGEFEAGDIITSITVDGVTRSVTRTHHVIDHMMRARVGSEVTMTVERNGETVSATVTIPASAVTTVK